MFLLTPCIQLSISMIRSQFICSSFRDTSPEEDQLHHPALAPVPCHLPAPVVQVTTPEHLPAANLVVHLPMLQFHPMDLPCHLEDLATLTLDPQDQDQCILQVRRKFYSCITDQTLMMTLSMIERGGGWSETASSAALSPSQSPGSAVSSSSGNQGKPRLDLLLILLFCFTN